eukprot:snap_masked-scaffold_6-processed-gene-8.27-mRNA-1 protein AED:0.54 eAED:0.54 QI:0/-1/0/1/-1/1/1/0/830
MTNRAPVELEDKLALYGLFNQAKRGDCKRSEPIDTKIITVQKWEAWNSFKGLTKDQAKERYVDLAYKVLKESRATMKAVRKKAATRSYQALKNRRNSELKRKFLGDSSQNRPKSPAARKAHGKTRGRRTKQRDNHSEVRETGLTELLTSPQQQRAMEGKKPQKLTDYTTYEGVASPAPPPSPYLGLTRQRSKARTQQRNMESASVGSRSEDNVELPNVLKTSSVALRPDVKKNLFRSRAFSSVVGENPMFDGMEDNIGERYELYDRLRTFYMQVEPSKLKKGIGYLVEWTMEHGEGELNVNLKKKYGKNLRDLEKVQSEDLAKRRENARAQRESQILLSRRLAATKDPETRKKMDKLTRFLLVNDPELVSRGMFLMMKFIENKGLGALNKNLKANYGKTLDSVSDEQLNEELKKKYGNDLQMLNQPLFGNNEEGRSTVQSVVQDTLQNQMQNLNINPQKLMPVSSPQQSRPRMQTVDINEELKRKQTVRKTSRASARNSANRKQRQRVSRPRVKGLQSPGRSAVSTPANSTRQFRLTTDDLDDPKLRDQFEARLKKFLRRFEPNRFENALDIMLEFTKNDGISELNKKLKNKYMVNLENFDKIPVSTSADLTHEEFQFRLLQFVNKHESPENIDKAVTAMTKYHKKHGIDALNTKLYMKYGETLNNFGDEDEWEDSHSQATSRVRQSARRGQNSSPQMKQFHQIDLPRDFLEKLKSYYVKYDPMVLAEDQVDKVFEWAKRNGEENLDSELQKKYGESLSNFMLEEENLRKELHDFYTRVDPRKVSQGFEKILQWAMVNGRDALNFNLRKKYNKDLDSNLGRSGTDQQLLV